MTKNQKFNKKGRYVYPNGSIYQGHYVDGKREGTGTFCDRKGNQYDGQWKADKYDVHGVEKMKYGKIIYEGEFKDGKKTGLGKLTFDNNVYEGDFKNGKFSGKGVYKFASGAVYEGDFENNVYHGKGKLTSDNQNVYQGCFEKGKKNGSGT